MLTVDALVAQLNSEMSFLSETALPPVTVAIVDCNVNGQWVSP